MEQGQGQCVAVIGGAGHVGLGMCLVLARAGYQVYGIDINRAANERIMAGAMPFREEHGEELLRDALHQRRLTMTDDFSPIASCSTVLFVVGTPIDAYLNPDLQPLTGAFRAAKPHFRRGQLIVLRSTVSPGTTTRIRALFEDEFQLLVGRDIHLVFAPERVLQGKVIEELTTLPQLIGAFDDASYERAETFFRTCTSGACFQLTPVEAEIGKLMTNMARYVQFALANEYYLIAESFGANIHRIIDACTHAYPRLHLPRPGPNVGGPCLHKDGFFLLERLPFPDLISVAFKINEGMPAQVLRKIESRPATRRVGILGMTFKAESDDPRDSLSFKFKRLLENAGYGVVGVDPHLAAYADLTALSGVDCIVVMTPHRAFRDLHAIAKIVANPDCLAIDIWGFWEEMKHRAEGCCFTLGAASAALGWGAGAEHQILERTESPRAVKVPASV